MERWEFLSLKASCRIKSEVVAIRDLVSCGLRDRHILAQLSRNHSTATSSSMPRASSNGPRTRQSTERLQAIQRIVEGTAQKHGGATSRLFLDDEGSIELALSSARVGDIICGFDESNIVAVL